MGAMWNTSTELAPLRGVGSTGTREDRSEAATRWQPQTVSCTIGVNRDSPDEKDMVLSVGIRHQGAWWTGRGGARGGLGEICIGELSRRATGNVAERSNETRICAQKGARTSTCSDSPQNPKRTRGMGVETVWDRSAAQDSILRRVTHSPQIESSAPSRSIRPRRCARGTRSPSRT
jgi:hypothetical protein